jgi:hypothetical protein
MATKFGHLGLIHTGTQLRRQAGSITCNVSVIRRIEVVEWRKMGSKKSCWNVSLKGQLHEIFDLRFFHQLTPPIGP